MFITLALFFSIASLRSSSVYPVKRKSRNRRARRYRAFETRVRRHKVNRDRTAPRPFEFRSKKRSAIRFLRDSFVAVTVAAVRYADKLVCLRWRFSRLKGRAERKKGTLRNGKGRSCHIPDFPVYLDVTKRGGANRHGGTGTTQEAGIATYVRTYLRTYVLVTFRDTRFELSGSCPRAILHAVAAPGASVNGHCTASTPRKTGSFPREIAANESLAALNS